MTDGSEELPFLVGIAGAALPGLEDTSGVGGAGAQGVGLGVIGGASCDVDALVATIQSEMAVSGEDPGLLSEAGVASPELQGTAVVGIASRVQAKTGMRIDNGNTSTGLVHSPDVGSTVRATHNGHGCANDRGLITLTIKDGGDASVDGGLEPPLVVQEAVV